LKIFQNKLNFEVGESIIRIIGDKTNLFTSELRTFNNNREVIISISEEYLHKLIFHVLMYSNYLMLVNPNSPDKNGKLFTLYSLVKQVIFIILLIL